MAEDYIVKRGNTLHLEDGKTYEYGTLTLEKDSKIEVTGTVTLRVDTLIKEDN